MAVVDKGSPVDSLVALLGVDKSSLDTESSGLGGISERGGGFGTGHALDLLLGLFDDLTFNAINHDG